MYLNLNQQRLRLRYRAPRVKKVSHQKFRTRAGHNLSCIFLVRSAAGPRNAAERVQHYFILFVNERRREEEEKYSSPREALDRAKKENNLVSRTNFGGIALF